MPRDNIRIGMGHVSLRHKIDCYLAGIGFGLNPAGLCRSRMARIIALESATDAQLAEIGLRRDEILPFVFRDLLAA